MCKTLPGVKVADFYSGVTAATMSKGRRSVKGKNQRSLKFYTLVEFLVIFGHRRRYAEQCVPATRSIKAFNLFGLMPVSAGAINLQSFALKAPGARMHVAKRNTPPGAVAGGV